VVWVGTALALCVAAPARGGPPYRTDDVAINVLGKEGSISFLKKRNKKLLIVG
jgi:hypothetical protein